ncbi:DUF418 domain-containing protein [Sphingosinithalassobacter tenebrarum]|uniref:DUF418 domain-containing protein n=2 Tax=Stakelama tenebrarum TaxID=2711215 RepID=A0A6G6YAN8_9SPHN|nr:DUF418 domain-containing protein [Sphingosinithalassobacter tenebrarum]
MGILLMNIVAFSMPMAAYINPTAFGGATGADLATYLVNYVLFDGKMRGLFSFLFGASTLLVIERAQSRGVSAAGVHYARMFWLLLFGLAHLFLIWWGDILAHYAIMGMILWFFRNRSVGKLILIGVLLLVLEFLLMASMPMWIWALQNGHAGDAAQTAKGMLAMQKTVGVPPAGIIDASLAVHRGDYAAIVADRIARHGLAPINMIFFVGPETLAYMLFGMAGYRSGMLTGAWSRGRYVRWLLIGFGISLPAYIAGAVYMVQSDFDMLAVASAVMTMPVIFRPLMILGWACLIILLMREGGALTARIAAAGRMAFSNYLLTSILCATFFYGYGFGFFGYLSRFEIYAVVLVVWALMLLWSKPWLERFRYGPLEWLWRSLSRGRPQPLAGGAIADA